MDQHLPISDADLHAYIDGQLDPARRLDVEAFLAERPDLAAEVMDGLRLNGEIRQFLAGEAAPPAPTTVALGHHLAITLRLQGLAHRLHDLVPRFRTGIAAACLVGLGAGLGWTGHAELAVSARVEPDVATDPAAILAGDAAQAWRVVQLDLTGEGASTGSATVAAVPGPELPLPNGLRRVGADLVPWDGGTAALELLVTSRGDELVLLTAETPVPAVERPEAESGDGVTTVSWRSGRFAYALSGDVPPSELIALAMDMDPGS